MFDNEKSVMKLVSIIRWGKAFSPEKLQEAQMRLDQIRNKVKKRPYLKKDKGISEMLDLIGMGVFG